MGYRESEKRTGVYGAEFGARRGAYSDLNIDPYAGRRIKAGKRQEDWQDILAHGERSDTDWGHTFKEGAQQLRRTYAPKGDWAKRKHMDATSQLMYDISKTSPARTYTRVEGGISEGGGWSTSPEATATWTKDRDVAAAKWMAEYNKNLNIHERIGLSQKRQAYRERFASMQITRERTSAKKTRDVLKRGASGLSVNFGAGAGTGLGI